MSRSASQPTPLARQQPGSEGSDVLRGQLKPILVDAGVQTDLGGFIDDASSIESSAGLSSAAGFPPSPDKAVAAALQAARDELRARDARKAHITQPAVTLLLLGEVRRERDALPPLATCQRGVVGLLLLVPLGLLWPAVWQAAQLRLLTQLGELVLRWLDHEPKLDAAKHKHTRTHALTHVAWALRCTTGQLFCHERARHASSCLGMRRAMSGKEEGNLMRPAPWCGLGAVVVDLEVHKRVPLHVTVFILHGLVQVWIGRADEFV